MQAQMEPKGWREPAHPWGPGGILEVRRDAGPDRVAEPENPTHAPEPVALFDFV